MTLSRRDLVRGMTIAAAVLPGAPAGAADEALRFGPSRRFSFADLVAEARSRSHRPFTPGTRSESLKALDYDAIGEVRYRPEAALWRESNSYDPVEFFHVGRYAATPVTINVVNDDQARQILYSDGLFDIPANNPARRLPPGLGFAGFRVLNRNGKGDWLAFLGASYFRSAKPFDQYGLSMRGLGIDTATSRAEEFPAFTEFWLGHDADGNLVIHALLEGPSVVGAYRFSHRTTELGLTQEVDARLNVRAPVERLGIAPLTSMFWYGRSDSRQAADWRPQIHDSDGLAIWTGAGERIWRPLANPPRILTNTYLDNHPRGFGLMQRDRNFEDYQDDGAFYDRRPSLWVEPVGDWGAGSVELVEIPTNVETDDNVVAFWTPRRRVTMGDALAFKYRLHWVGAEPDPPHIGQVVATRSGIGGRPGQPHDKGSRKFVIDFEGGALATLDRRRAVRPNVVLSVGSPIAPVVYPVVGTDRWRLVFDIALGPGQTVDMRAFLGLNGDALTETWTYQAFG